MPAPIRKAVFPVAGLGTRFLPATKAVPKEMLTVVDRPIIQYVVDEAREAGIEHFIFVTGRNKHVIADHFDMAFELEQTLRDRGKQEALDLLEEIRPAPGTASFTRQQEPLGLGHAVWCAREMIGHEPFAVLLPDVLVKAGRGCLGQMIDAYEKTGRNIIAVEEVPEDQTHHYGVIDVEGEGQNGLYEVRGMVEKPKPGTAPSNLIITGRYILQPEVFGFLENQETGAGGEIQLTDALLKLMETQGMSGLAFEGKTYDCGSKIGFLAANVAYALGRPDLGEEFRATLNDLLN